MAADALLVFGLLLGLVITAAVGIDAHDRGRSGFLWGLLTFFTGLVGAFFYLLVVLTGEGPDDGAPDTLRRCGDCGATHTGQPDYCSDCGAVF